MKPPKYEDFTPLNMQREGIINEVISIQFKCVGVFFPKRKSDNQNVDKTKYCKFHKQNGHNTKCCMHLKEIVDDLICEVKLASFVNQGKQIRDQQPQAPYKPWD